MRESADARPAAADAADGRRSCRRCYVSAALAFSSALTRSAERSATTTAMPDGRCGGNEVPGIARMRTPASVARGGGHRAAARAAGASAADRRADGAPRPRPLPAQPRAARTLSRSPTTGSTLRGRPPRITRGERRASSPPGAPRARAARAHHPPHHHRRARTDCANIVLRAINTVCAAPGCGTNQQILPPVS